MGKGKKGGGLILLVVTLSLLLSGCGKQSEVVTIDNKQYLKKGDSYTSIEQQAKTFAPGEHTIYYQQPYEYGNDVKGWGTSLNIPEAPNGYEYVDTIVLGNGGYGRTSDLIYIYRNTVTVEVTSTYSEASDEIGFFEPGRPVITLTLEQ